MLGLCSISCFLRLILFVWYIMVNIVHFPGRGQFSLLQQLHRSGIWFVVELIILLLQSGESSSDSLKVHIMMSLCSKAIGLCK